MSLEGQKFYPGDEATALEVLALADEYRRAAETLLPTRRRRKPLSHAPYRLVAIQAIELHLNALMLSLGKTCSEVRGLKHGMTARAEFARSSGLGLRQSTISHLKKLDQSREYLITRYGPDLAGTLSQLNRLEATLKEVSSKVAKVVKQEAVTE